MFKFEGNQKVFISKNGHPVTVLGRTEFFNGKQARYYVQSETAIPGKNIAEDWINEDQLTNIAPVIEAPAEEVRKESGVRNRPGIRKRSVKAHN